ncbi:remorin family protein [Striga asiatica]|uniref:Remorin family protein n=1 Tax=Striga asiatica TaxID=4170 RepID=A0A5A7Q4G5_STRAF|nr:remorin family protein [Striga asiatica]
MATEAPVEVVPTKPEAEPPLAAVVDKPAVAPPPQEDAKALAKAPEPVELTTSKGSLDRDVALAKLEDEKRWSFIKAWEESEKTKVDNKAQKKLADVAAWENTKTASIEGKLKKIQEELEKKKAEYAEKMKNQVALIHKQAEEKRAVVEARRGEDFLKAEEMAAKYRATGHVPKKAFGCLGALQVIETEAINILSISNHGPDEDEIRPDHKRETTQHLKG